MLKPAASVVLALTALVLAGCTAAPAPVETGVAVATTEPASPSFASTPPATIPAELPAPNVSGIPLLQLSSQHGGVTEGPFGPVDGVITIAARCLGSGSLEVEVGDIGSFPLTCAADQPTTGVALDGEGRGEFTIMVTSTDQETIWAMTVAG